MFPAKIILLLFLQVLFLITKGQQVNFIKYTVQDGLVANPVRCIYQDSKGFIWLGTFEGLSRYDGYKFTNYTTSNHLSHSMVNSIFEVNGKLLIAENNGAVDIIQNNTVQKGLIATSAVNIITPYKDRLIITTDASGFYEYKNDTLVSPAQQKTGTALGRLLPLNDSLLICDGVDNYVHVFKKDLSVLLTIKNPGLHFHTLFKDSKNRIWAGTTGGLKLLEFNAGKNVTLAYRSLPHEFNFSPLNNAQVTSMIEDDDGSFWIGTSKGLVHISDGENYQVYNEKDGLPSAIIHTLYRDKEKNLWIGTASGLAKWAARNSVFFYNTENRQFKNDVASVFYLGKRRFILGTQHGPQLFDAKRKEFKDLTGGSNFPVPIEGSSPLLIYYPGRISKLDSGNDEIVRFEKLDSPIFGVSRAARHLDGTIFFGGFDGLFALKNRSVKQLFPYRITTLEFDKNGNAWFGTWNEGLFRVTIKDNTGTSYHVQDLTSVINQKQIRGLFIDRKNNIWVGTRYGGAFCLTPIPGGKFKVQQFNRQFGIMSDWATAFAETDSGDIFIGSYLGIDKLVNEPPGYRVFNFSKAINFFAEIRKIIPAGDDEWICQANTGIAYFKDEGLHQMPAIQATILSGSLGSLENKLTIFSPQEKVSLKPDQNTARFEFSALGFINERQILYSYRLKGSNDTTWSKPENIHEASYASLSPGEYTFEVKTFGWNGREGIPATFSFSIRTPFWKQGWFIALSICLILIFFYGLYRYRIMQLVRLQNVRNNIATDLHDDIGSSLTNISILSELSSKNLSDTEKAQPFLQRISEEVQASSQAMDDIIWSVNTRNDSLQETIARMRRYAAELFDNSQTNCHLQLDENTGSKKLSMEQRRDVYLIYKEALNNIHKHARANNIWIEVSQNQNHLLMQIKDDGRGFDMELVTNRNGLKNLRSRVEKWNGKIMISAKENLGTNIEIKIPLRD
ncbi:MAG TPA: two-component regulator propeller domain-containing protein [Chitinophagaceae bacterium]